MTQSHFNRRKIRKKNSPNTYLNILHNIVNIISIFKKNLFQQEKLSKNTENQNKTKQNKQTNKKQEQEESQVAKRP